MEKARFQRIRRRGMTGEHKQNRCQDRKQRLIRSHTSVEGARPRWPQANGWDKLKPGYAGEDSGDGAEIVLAIEA